MFTSPGEISDIVRETFQYFLPRQLLVGSLPIVMMFDIPETLQVDDSVISKVQVSLTVYYLE